MRTRWLILAAMLAACGDDEGGVPGGKVDAGGSGGSTGHDASQDTTRPDVGTTSDGPGTTDSVNSGDASDALGTSDSLGPSDATGAGDAVDDAADARSDAPTDARPINDAPSADATADARDASSDVQSADVAPPIDTGTDAGAADAGSPDADDDALMDAPPPDGVADAAPTDAGSGEACTPMSTSITRTPTSATSAFTPVNDVAWTNLVFVTDVSQISYANTTAALDATSTRSRALIVTGYGFDIPTDARIDGIVVDIWRGSANSTTAGIRDDIVRLQSGLVNSLSRAKTDKWPATVFTTVPNYGGQLDKWGTSWTPAMINASSFGVYLTAQRYATAADTPRVGWVEITVHYTTACP